MLLNELKFLCALQQKKYRKEYKSFLVEGEKSVVEVLNSNFTVKKVYATTKWSEKHVEFTHPVEVVSEKECERISSLKTPPAIFAWVAMKPKSDFDHEKHKKILLLDDVKDAGNLGTIIRTADWFGIGGIVCSENTVELYNPKTIQASMGSFTRVEVYRTDLNSFITENIDRYTFFGACMQGESIREFHFPEYSAVVLGSETKGISPAIETLLQERICIPCVDVDRSSLPESLNVSMATAIVCYELAK